MAQKGGCAPMSREFELSTFVHRENISKYRRILGTHLTDHERDFVNRRLAEEQAALNQLKSISARQGTEYDVGR